MTDETLDFYEQKRERELVARTGISRSLTPQKQLTRKEWEKMNGEVVTIKPALPNLPTMSERIKYLMGGMSTREFAKKVFYSQKTVSNWARGKFKPTDDALCTISRLCDVPLEWLNGNKQPKATQPVQSHTETDRPIEPKEPDKLIKPEKPNKKPVAFAMTFNGSMTGAEIKSYLCGLSDAVEYTVSVNVEKAV